MHILAFMSISPHKFISPNSTKYTYITYILHKIFNINIYECECLYEYIYTHEIVKLLFTNLGKAVKFILGYM